MSKTLIIMGLIALLAACASQPQDAETIIRAGEGKADMLDFRDVVKYPGQITCGSYQVTSKWGESYGYQEFIVKGANLDKRPSQTDKTIYCSEDSQKAFEEQFGIAPTDKHNAALTQFREDYETLSRALEAYRADLPRYPTAKEGLIHLLASAHETPPKKFKESGYLKDVPLDYWQRAYVYEPSRWGGVRSAYIIKTLGADGKVGGSGSNADISSEYLEYLIHLDSVR
ncbi:MAG: type II secretion system protein GspG [Halioglobus sp.]